MSDDNVRGRFLWYQLNATDPDSAVAFYTRVLPWGTQVWEGGDEPYTMWTREGQPMGGLLPIPDEAREAGARSHWLAYVGTPDVDATVRRAGDLGAALMVAPTDIPQVGRFAVLQDPQGALFAVYKPEREPPPAAEPRVGEISWHELATPDHEAASAFYAELFGWKELDPHDMGEMGPYRMFGFSGDDGRTFAALYARPDEMPGPPGWLLYVRVEDLDRTLEEVKAAGGRVVNGPMEVPGGDRIAQCVDAQGGAFALHAKGSST